MTNSDEAGTLRPPDFGQAGKLDLHTPMEGEHSCLPIASLCSSFAIDDEAGTLRLPEWMFGDEDVAAPVDVTKLWGRKILLVLRRLDEVLK